MILRARLLAPIGQPPIPNGAVRIDGSRIARLGPWPELARESSQDVVDLGEVLLLPGLINAHCHLDYSAMAGLLPPPRSFTDWIKAIVALKAQWSYTEFAASWVHGAQMLLRSGVTTVADIESVPEILPDAWHATPLRVRSFRELIHLKPGPAAQTFVDQAVAQWDRLPGAAERVGLSPHAPYSTTPDLLTRAAQRARERRWLLTTHLAESDEEFLMFHERRGPMFDWLRPQRDMADCGLGSPVQALERVGYLGPDVLAVHVNRLAGGDALRLAQRGVSVVHCPRSHAYFGHAPFPRRELAGAGVNLCLGTDSLASVLKLNGQRPTLSLLAEMQALAQADPDLAPDEILRMATLHGARALHGSGQLGELAPGARADLIAIPFRGAPDQAAAAVVHHAGPVHASMIDGRWALAPGSARGPEA